MGIRQGLDYSRCSIKDGLGSSLTTEGEWLLRIQRAPQTQHTLQAVPSQPRET